MTEKIKVAAVSYLNAKPLMYGFDKGEILHDVDISYEYPANVAKLLANNQTDIGLVPVAAIPEIPNASIISDYGIAANGAVKSVCLYSEVPIHEIQSVYLDYQSRTSVRLCQLLFEEYWTKEVTWLSAPEDYISQIKGHTAGVIIGDRALEQLSKFKYVYDLSFYWKEHTGLPFVFAAWVTNKQLPSEFIKRFNTACALGFQHIDTIAQAHAVDYYDLYKYFTVDIDYKLDEQKRKGLSLFINKIHPNYPLNFHNNG